MFKPYSGEESRARTEQSFLVPKGEIAENGCDLSINKYKKLSMCPWSTRLPARFSPGSEHWRDGMMAKFSDLFLDATKDGYKIPKENYLSKGKYPIIDQGQKYIAGYSDNAEGLYEDVPAIIFGDHTRIIKYVDRPCFLGADGVKLLKAKDAAANYKYLYYALCYAKIPNTGYNRHFKWLKEIDIKLRDKHEQQHIVEVLDKLTGLISLRRQQLAKLDEAVQSQFIEMFGEPKKNPNVVSFESAFTIRDDLRKPINSAVRSKMHTGQLYPYYGANGQVDSINEYLMDCDAICLAEDCGAYGAGEATSFIVSGKCWVNNHAHVLIPKECCNIEFANVYFRILDMSEYVTGTTRLKLTQGQMKILPMILPPMDQQKRFAAFVRQSNQAKFAIQQGSDQLEILKKSLMQEYFG